MCDHCRTYKPMLDGANATPFYEQERPKMMDVPPRQSRPEAASNGCCSWRKTCCDGVCCSQVGNCCLSDQDAHARPAEKPAPFQGYGYGQPAMPSYPYGMTADATMPDRVPCTKQQEKKLPMCFGGDCGLSSGCSSKSDNSANGTMETGSTSKECQPWKIYPGSNLADGKCE